MDAILFFDGLCEPRNPGGWMAWGWTIKVVGKELTLEGGGAVEPDSSNTNNVAEYRAMIEGLRDCKIKGVRRLAIYGDSQLVVKQIKGEWSVKKPHLQLLVDEAHGLLSGFEKWSIRWVPRDDNTEADLISWKHYEEARGATL